MLRGPIRSSPTVPVPRATDVRRLGRVAELGGGTAGVELDAMHRPVPRSRSRPRERPRQPAGDDVERLAVAEDGRRR